MSLVFSFYITFFTFAIFKKKKKNTKNHSILFIFKNRRETTIIRIIDSMQQKQIASYIFVGLKTRHSSFVRPSPSVKTLNRTFISCQNKTRNTLFFAYTLSYFSCSQIFRLQRQKNKERDKEEREREGEGERRELGHSISLLKGRNPEASATLPSSRPSFNGTLTRTGKCQIR